MFAKALGLVAPIATRRTTLPVLSTILLEVGEPGGALITATDLDVRMTTCVTDCSVVEAGTVLLPAREVCEWLEHCGDGQMELQGDATELHMRIPGHGRLDLKTLAAEEFPPEIEAKAKLIANLDLAPLASILNCREKSKDQNQERYRHVSLLVEDEQILACAVDGKRAGVIAIKPEAMGEFRGELLLNGTAADMLRDVGVVKFEQSPNHFLFSQPGNDWVFARINVSPTPWKQLFDKFEFKGGCTVLREELLEAVGGAHCLRRLEGYVRIRVEPGDGVMVLTAATPEGSFRATVAAEGVLPWPPTDVASEHVLGFLKACKVDAAKFMFQERGPMKIELGEVTFINTTFEAPAAKNTAEVKSKTAPQAAHA